MERKIISILCILSIIISLVYLPQKVQAVLVNKTIMQNRLYGNNRYDTCAEICKYGWKNTSQYAIVVTGEDYPDALCAAPLAKKYNAPIILTTKDTLSNSAKEQLNRLGVTNIIIVGGEGVVSKNVFNQLQNLRKGISVRRICGVNRYETSAKVAEDIGTSNEIVLATGANFPDALSIAPIAASKGMPILLTAMDSLSAELSEYMANKNFIKTYVIGGTGVISDNVFDKLKNAKRLSGINRYATNTIILNEFMCDLKLSKAFIAVGTNFPDALAGSALAALTASPIILADNNTDTSTKNYINDNYFDFTEMIALGGIGVITSDTFNNILNNYGTTEMGNNINNSANQGNYCKKGNIVYFSNNFDSSKLYKMNLDGSGKTKLTDIPVHNINVIGNLIICTDYNNNIRSLHTDGTGLKLVSSDYVGEVVVLNGWIYYNLNTGNGYLYRMKTDGSQKTIIVKDGVNSKFYIKNGYIYYDKIFTDKGCIFRVQLDGSENTKIYNNAAVNYIVGNDGIYVFKQGLYKTNFDGTGEKLLNSNIVSSNSMDPVGIINGNYIYCYANGLERISTDGSNIQNISNNFIGYINSVGKWIVTSNGRIRADGSHCAYLSTESPDSFDFAGDTIYYSAYSPYISAPGTELKSIKKDGTGITNIKNGNFKNLKVSGNNLYYLKNDGYLYTCKSDGSSEKQMVNNRVDKYKIAGGYLYYSVDHSFSRMNLDGSDDTWLLSSVDNFEISDSKIYFTNYNNGDTVYVSDLDGQNSVPLPTSEAYNIKHYNGAVYYMSGSGIRKINDDGTGDVSLVNTSGINEFDIDNGYIYYTVNESQGLEKLIKVKIDGTGPMNIIEHCGLNDFKINAGAIYFLMAGNLYNINEDGTRLTQITPDNQDIFYNFS